MAVCDFAFTVLKCNVHDAVYCGIRITEMTSVCKTSKESQVGNAIGVSAAMMLLYFVKHQPCLWHHFYTIFMIGGITMC